MTSRKNAFTSISSAIVAASILAASASPALAQQPAPGNGMAMPGMPMHQGMPMPGMSMPGMPMRQGAPMSNPATDANPSTQAFKAADDKMMQDINRPMSGDADRDFVAEMLPHHQGAVEMAKVELQYGKNPELRRLARGIVAAQEKEITQMQAWQKKHPARP